MRIVDLEKLKNLQKDPKSIRNICILAHVDHGKTTLADCLVASNGIISTKLAGKLRYMDSRNDEQQRGITMKSSSISLFFNNNDEEYLLNVIDSPGHIDFASEVSTAVRLCDGAIIIVDVVEGVCPQTRSALSMTYIEGLKPILVMNKIDRLITEIKLTPLDAYIHLTQILEQVNAVMGGLFASDVMQRDEIIETAKNNKDSNSTERSLTDWQSTLEEADDSNLYFSPERGNVLFTSAIDGWGFGIKEFAKMLSEKLGFSEKVLAKTLWGDYYLNMKNKRIMKGAQEKAKKPLFVSLILENLWTLYDIVLVKKDKEKMMSMMEKMNIKLTNRDLRVTDTKVQLNAIASQWLPLAKACLSMVCDNVPAPHELSGDKIERLMSGNNDFSSLPSETQQLKSAFLACSSSQDAPIIAFVSKMFSADKKSFSENKTRMLTQEELVQRREIVRQRHAMKLEQLESEKNESNDHGTTSNDKVEEENQENIVNEEEAKMLIGFARVYSGLLKPGAELFVLGPKHNPETVLERMKNNEPVKAAASLKDLKSGWYVTKVVITKLYLMMGRELETVEQVPAGNVIGIGGLEEHVLKTATLSSTMFCPSFTELTSLTVPILRVALEPKHPNDLQKLVNGLKLLNQADCCARMHIQETGEIVLSTAGEVHLERCLDDLKQRYAKVEINVSEPIIPFRETVVPPPITDMVNEAIEKKTHDEPLEFWTTNHQCFFEIDAKPLPEQVIKILDDNSDLLKQLDMHWEQLGKQECESLPSSIANLSIDETSITNKKLKSIETFKNDLSTAFHSANWGNVLNEIWSFGPKKCGPNILLNESDYKRLPFWMKQLKQSTDPRATYDNSIINGFQLATIAGPLCEEPMRGVCFIVKKWQIYEDAQSECSGQSNLSGQLISAFKEACRRALNMRRPRLVAPMYSCSVLVNSDVLGKLYAVFGRRHGRVIAADNALGFGGQFQVHAVLPVPESFNLASELRTSTSGLATPQLVFSHWEVIEQDPFWVPSTEEEYLHFGEKGDTVNRAKKYIDAVRRRKGLPVDSQLVTHAEKQRTLSKNK
ncbi:elongation factor-like GTPase 1 [Chelonus insularis]|uniref:elongation factor-like GTPase 1 n=1 Tax=Chelonus insularis TaxID=460826 RepID=UPI001589E4D5|nr:elongation factor-like GTPase 1 [Chelonus insularis]